MMPLLFSQWSSVFEASLPGCLGREVGSWEPKDDWDTDFSFLSWREGCRVCGVGLAEVQGLCLAPLLATGKPGLG